MNTPIIVYLTFTLLFLGLGIALCLDGIYGVKQPIIYWLVGVLSMLPAVILLMLEK